MSDDIHDSLSDAGFIVQADDKSVTFENGTMMSRDAYEALMRHPDIAPRLGGPEVVFGDPAKSGGVVESTEGQRFLVTGSSAWMGEDGVKREAPEFSRIGTKTVEHNFSTAHAKTIDMVRALWRKQMAYQWGGKFWRVTSIVERNPGEADVRSIEAHRPAMFFDLQGWIAGEIISMPIELDCPPLPVVPIPNTLWIGAPPRPSIISKLMARRRKIIASARKRSDRPEDKAVGEAISAMTRKGGAHEL